MSFSFVYQQKGLFSSSCEETVLSAVTTLMFLTTPDTKKGKPTAKKPLTANNDLLACLNGENYLYESTVIQEFFVLK